MYKINSGVGSKFESGGQDVSKTMKSNKKGSFVMVMHNFAKPPHLWLINYIWVNLFLYRTVAVTIVVVCAVGITLCMLLYCCCCQRRPGIHEGKLIWIKKKKDKIGTYATLWFMKAELNTDMSEIPNIELLSKYRSSKFP